MYWREDLILNDFINAKKLLVAVTHRPENAGDPALDNRPE